MARFAASSPARTSALLREPRQVSSNPSFRDADRTIGASAKRIALAHSENCPFSQAGP